MSDELATLAQLFADFATASLLAIGGGSAALPELHTVVVADTHWLSDQQFKEIYSLGQVAPGPNMTVVAVIGRHVAGWAGALVTLVAFFVPSSLLAGVWLLARLAIDGVPTLAIAIVATAILLAWRVSPLWLIVAGASLSWLVSG